MPAAAVWRSACFELSRVRASDLLGTIDLFEQLSREDLDDLSHCASERRVLAGELVCSDDLACEALFVVVEGRIEIGSAAQTRGTSEVSKVRLGIGEAWGEMVLISGERAWQEARAIEDSRLLELQKDDFEAFVASRPQAMRSILAAVSRRAVQANQRLLADEPRDATAALIGRAY